MRIVRSSLLFVIQIINGFLILNTDLVLICNRHIEIGSEQRLDYSKARERLQEQVRKKIQQLSQVELSKAITNSIGERRVRDLIDFLVGIELKDSWDVALDYLENSMNRDYEIPPLTGKKTRRIEPLKFREVLFSIFGCQGIEAIDMETSAIISKLHDAHSIANAEILFKKIVNEELHHHLKKSNFLFIDTDAAASCLENNLVNQIHQEMENNLSSISLISPSHSIDISSLWYTEYGRIALCTLGIPGSKADKETLDMVLSVLPVSQRVRDKIMKNRLTKNLSPPLNDDYQSLLKAMIDQDTMMLAQLGSRNAIPLMNYLLEESVDEFNSEYNSQKYSKITTQLSNHLFIRSIDSVLSLEKMVAADDYRISSLGIIALGNYYHESAVSLLAETICATKNDNLRNYAIQSLNRIKTKFPETKSLLKNLVDSIHKGCKELRRFLEHY